MSNRNTEYVPVQMGPVVSDPSLGNIKMWCGPAVVSAFTGSSYQAVAHWLAHRSRRASARGVRGTSTDEIQAALAQCGLASWRVKRYPSESRPTLAAWLRGRSKDWRSASWIVQVGHHWVAVKGRKLVDNHTKQPVFISKAPHRRKRVHQIIVVNKTKHSRAKPILK